SQLGLDGKLDLIDDHRLYSFCCGFLRPKVCISHTLANSLTDAELKAVLLHEKYHLKNRDPLKILLSRAMAEMLFLLPVASNLRDRYIRAKELAADDATVDFMGTELPLASALLKILSQRSQVLTTELAAIGALSVTEQRIERLLDPAADFLPAISMPKFVASAAMLAMLFLVSIAPVYAQPGTNVVGPNCHLPSRETCPVVMHAGPSVR
ncbi:MAG: M56 family metallopeptidase, partial [Chloroflexi bacterium]|nr:M56 family metallopeptidase [Chloroflexota bacterium]